MHLSSPSFVVWQKFLHRDVIVPSGNAITIFLLVGYNMGIKLPSKYLHLCPLNTTVICIIRCMKEASLLQCVCV